MSALDFLLPWDRQPQEVVEVDYSNVIARSARSVILPSLGPTDLVLPSRAITKNANCNTSPSSDGIAYSSSDANSGLLFSGSWNDVVPPSSPITFFARVYVAAIGIRRVLLADWSAAGANESIAVETTAANQWRQYSQGAVRITGGSVTVGWHTIVVSQSATQSSEIWIDGVSIGSSSVASTRNNGSTAAWLDSGAYTGGIGWSTNKASLMAVCEMYADGDIAKSFHDNPWQLFAPQSIWVPVSAGGGGGVNLVIADSAHAHAADNIGLTLDTYLAVNEALHAHTADNLTLSTTGSTDLTVADSAHAQALDNVVLTSQAYLAVADMLHAHALDGVTLTLGGASLTVAELLHAHALDGAALTLDTYLEVDDAVHGHTLDGIVLTPVGTDAVAVSLGGRAKPHRKGLRFQDYDVPLPPEVLTSTIPQDTPPTGIKPAPSLSAYALRPASKLATRPARVKAPKAQAPAPAPVATPESQATPAVAIVPVVAAAAPVSAAAKPPRAMALADILSAQDLTHDELLQAVKLLARELQDGPALRLVRSHRIALRR